MIFVLKELSVVDQLDQIKLDEVQGEILGQLRARKERGRAGAIERIQKDNQAAANIRAGLINIDPRIEKGDRNLARLEA